MANTYGFPPAAEKEKERVRKKLNPQGQGILAEAVLPAQSQPKSITHPLEKQEAPLSRVWANVRRNAGMVGDFLAQDRTQSTRQGIQNVKQGVAGILSPEAQGAETPDIASPSTGVAPLPLPSHTPVQTGVAAAPQARITDAGKVLTNLAAPNIAGPSSIDGQPIDLASRTRDMQRRKVTGKLANGTEYTYFADAPEQAAQKRKGLPSIADPQVSMAAPQGIADYTPWWQQEGAENSGMGMTGKVSRLRAGYDQFRAQGLSHADAARQAELQDTAKMGAPMFADYLQNQDRANRKSRIDEDLSGAQTQLALTEARKNLAMASPEYLAAKGQEARQTMMTNLIGTNESFYKSILQYIKDSPEASKHTPQQLTQLAREEAWKSTLDTFQKAGGIFTDAQGNETDDGQRLKEGFEAYRRALVNLDQRRDSGQLDEQAYNKEYRALNQKWMDIRDSKPPTITS